MARAKWPALFICGAPTNPQIHSSGPPQSFYDSFMSHEDWIIVVRLVVALAVGGLIGLERTLHGRPAGFRTHALVCLASSLLMLVTVYQLHWMTEVPLDTITADPTRM